MRDLKDAGGVADIERDLRFMCATVGVRLAGAPEDAQVAGYVAERFRELGLVNVAALPFACRRFLPGQASLAVVDPPGRVISAMQTTHTPPTPPGGVEGDLVVFEPVDWEDGLRRKDLDGKIGLFHGGYGESSAVFGALHSSGLAALIFVDTRLTTEWPIANGMGERFMQLVRKPMAYVSFMDAWRLVRDGVRRVRLTCGGTTEDATSRNVVGELPGVGACGRIIVIGGHMDSVAGSVGADDDASGIAAVLECARRLHGHDRRHTLRFIAFGAEEQLSVGSNRYVRDQAADLERVGLMCNFDSIGAPLGLSAAVCVGTPALDAYVSQIVDADRCFGRAVTEVTPYVDAFPFNSAGIPSVWFCRNTHLGGHWYHHAAHNDLAAVSATQIAWTAEVACDIVGDLAARETWPFPRDIELDLRAEIDQYRRQLF